MLDTEPQNAMAYVGKLMAELGVRRMEDLRNQEDSFANRNNYQKALRFADEELKTTLTGYIAYITGRNDSERLELMYKRAKMAMGVTTEFMYKEAAKLFEELAGYKDSAACARECYEKAEIIRKDGILASAKSKMIGSLASNYEDAIEQFKTIPGWKDADRQIQICQEKVAKLRRTEDAIQKNKERQEEESRMFFENAAKLHLEANRVKRKLIWIVLAVACIAAAALIFLNEVVLR